MDTQIINSTQKEVTVLIKGSEVGTLYIIQNELLKTSGIDFAGVILKHPLTNEIRMRVNSSKGNPINEISKAADSAIKNAASLKKLFNSKIKGN